MQADVATVGSGSDVLAQAQPAQPRGELATTGFGAVELALLALGIAVTGRMLVAASRVGLAR